MHETTMTRSKLGRALMALLVAMSLGGLAAASCGEEKKDGGDEASAESPSADQKEPGAGKAPEAPKAGDEGGDEAYPEDLYPGFNFGVLEQKERAQFVEIARAELCPCPDSSISLHKCLQKEGTQCHTAQYSAMLIAQGIKEKKSQTDILDDVAQYVEAMKATHEFTLEGRPYRGDPDAKVVLVEFADFQCPHCRMAADTMEKVANKYGDDIAFYYKHFPLSSHPRARQASIASMAAHEQGKFWPMHDLLFKNQTALSPAKFKDFARQLGLNMSKFEEDMKDPAIIKKVETDRTEGEEAQLSGTPSLFVNGKHYMGEKTVEGISAYLDPLLEAKEEGGDTP